MRIVCVADSFLLLRPAHIDLLLPTGISALGVDLLSQLLRYDPAQRISARKALQHPWFSEKPYPKTVHSMPTFPTSLSQLQQVTAAQRGAAAGAEASHGGTAVAGSSGLVGGIFGGPAPPAGAGLPAPAPAAAGPSSAAGPSGSGSQQDGGGWRNDGGRGGGRGGRQPREQRFGDEAPGYQRFRFMRWFDKDFGVRVNYKSYDDCHPSTCTMYQLMRRLHV